MSVTVGIAGVTGYAGGEALRLFLGHPALRSGELAIGPLTGKSSAGRPADEVLPAHPQLAGRVVEETSAEALAGCDAVILCLPHAAGAALTGELSEGPDAPLLIDCSADHRLTDPADWAAFYGGEYPGAWTYGLPELPGRREEVRASRAIAVPGCFPTGATLALAPGVAAGLLEPAAAVTSVTGVSGAGKKPSVGLLAGEVIGSLRAYKVAGAHRHTPEIAQNLKAASGRDVAVSFTPVLAPLTRGILTAASAKLSAGATPAALRAAYQEFADAEPFIHLLAEGAQPETQNVVGSNSCHLQVAVDEATGTAVITSAIDNLTKGTAGAAIQCLNLALGLPEDAGLSLSGLAP